MQRTAVPKYQRVFDVLSGDIASGRVSPGMRLPSEAELVRRFGASRITIGRAMRDLQQQGLVERRAGSGTYVRRAVPQPAVSDCTFGILVPDLPEIEIFEPLVQGLVGAPDARPHAFLWGGDVPGASRTSAAWARCQQYIARHVQGVFFAPLEGRDVDDTNQRIAAACDAAGIPVVLLDRSVQPYPRRGAYDLVGIDNRRAGFAVTEHLLRQGAARVAFLAGARGASTVGARRAGYREALDVLEADRVLADAPVPAPDDRDAVMRYLETHAPDGVVSANDRLAAALMHTLLALGCRVPQDVRLVGIDDVEYAAWLPVPLTTLRQPVRQIGEAALAAMMERLARPDLPARDIFLQTTLVVRESSGLRAQGLGRSSSSSSTTADR